MKNSMSGDKSPGLIESLFCLTAVEVRVRGTHQALTPVMEAVRDPRRGRVEETYGKHPFLVSRMGIAAVRGVQGDAKFQEKREACRLLFRQALTLNYRSRIATSISPNWCGKAF